MFEAAGTHTVTCQASCWLLVYSKGLIQYRACLTGCSGGKWVLAFMSRRAAPASMASRWGGDVHHCCGQPSARSEIDKPRHKPGATWGKQGAALSDGVGMLARKAVSCAGVRGSYVWCCMA